MCGLHMERLQDNWVGINSSSELKGLQRELGGPLEVQAGPGGSWGMEKNRKGVFPHI